jgi:hypothetical protein
LKAIRLSSTTEHRLGSVIAEISNHGWHEDCSHCRRKYVKRSYS